MLTFRLYVVGIIHTFFFLYLLHDTKLRFQCLRIDHAMDATIDHTNTRAPIISLNLARKENISLVMSFTQDRTVQLEQTQN